MEAQGFNPESSAPTKEHLEMRTQPKERSWVTHVREHSPGHQHSFPLVSPIQRLTRTYTEYKHSMRVRASPESFSSGISITHPLKSLLCIWYTCRTVRWLTMLSYVPSVVSVCFCMPTSLDFISSCPCTLSFIVALFHVLCVLFTSSSCPCPFEWGEFALFKKTKQYNIS